MEFITLRSVVVPSLHMGITVQDLQVVNSVYPCMCFEDNYYVIKVCMECRDGATSPVGQVLT